MIKKGVQGHLLIAKEIHSTLEVFIKVLSEQLKMCHAELPCHQMTLI